MSRSVVAVVRATLPSIAWLPVAAGPVALVVTAIGIEVWEPDDPLSAARLAVLAWVAALAFALEDPVDATTASYPVAYRLRCFARVAVPVGIAAGCWGALALATAGAGGSVRLLAAETAALAATGFAVTLTARRLGSRRPGLVVGPVLLGVVLLSLRLGRWALLPYDVAAHHYRHPLETAATRSLLIVAIALVVAFVMSSDPVRSRRLGGLGWYLPKRWVRAETPPATTAVGLVGIEPTTKRL